MQPFCKGLFAPRNVLYAVCVIKGPTSSLPCTSETANMEGTVCMCCHRSMYIYIHRLETHLGCKLSKMDAAPLCAGMHGGAAAEYL